MPEKICSACNAPNSAESNFCTDCQAHLGQAAVIAGLEARIVELEQRVANAAQQPTQSLASASSEVEETVSAETPRAAQPHPRSEKPATDWRAVAERWLGRIGVVLVIFAAIFLFRYAIDQGWLTEERRVLAGFLSAIVLTVGGWLLRRKRPALGRALMGGGIATFYVVGYAAFDLYDLISFTAATIYFIVVTAIAIVVSVWQDEGTLVLLAALGRFLTPMLLSSGPSDSLRLSAYTIILVLGLSIVFWRKGWLLLQRMLTYGGWFYVGLAIGDFPYSADTNGVYRLVVTSAVAVMALAGWLVPVVRQLRERRSDNQLAPLSLEFGQRFLPDGLQSLVVRYSLLSVIATPFIVAVCIVFIFNRFTNADELQTLGWVFVVSAIVYLVVAGLLWSKLGDRAVTATHFIAVAMLGVGAVAALVESEHWLFVACAIAVALLAVLARWIKASVFAVALYSFSLMLALWIFGRIIDTRPYYVYLTWPRAATLLGILAFVCGAVFGRNKQIKTIYWIASHLLFLGWLANVLSMQQGFVSIAWGVYAAILLVVGLVAAMPKVQPAALTTIGLIVVKLFLVDLSDVEAIWRVLLFLGLVSACWC